jgi:hypothetical protein
MVIAIVAVCLFLMLLLVKVVSMDPIRDQNEENRIKDQEMTKDIIQALRDTNIIRKYETVNEELLQPYARRLWKSDCPTEQIQIGLEVADVVTQHSELVEIDPVLHRRSQFTVIVNKKLTQS